tara:strand:+ start:5984 stop:6985 length:1002 start_codon:yes stop_codon:yes gene_type:complete
MKIKEKIKKLLSEVSPDKYFIYRKGDVTGLGNKLRGIHIAFLTSLLTKRKFICNYHYLNNYFNAPDGLNWDPSQLPNKKFTERIIAPLQSEQELHEMCTLNLDDYLKEDIIIHHQGNTWVSDFLSNPHYTEKLNWLFDGDLSMKNVIGSLMEYLLSIPKEGFMETINLHKNNMGLDFSIPTVGFQYRTFYVDDPSYSWPETRMLRDMLPEAIDKFIEKVKEWYPDNNVQIFLTTDDMGHTYKIKESLSPHFKVIHNTNSVIHTQHETPTINPSMVDWFLLGYSDSVFSTFTSYSLLACARLNHPQKHLYKYSPPLFEGAINYHGELTNEHYAL